MGNELVTRDPEDDRCAFVNPFVEEIDTEVEILDP